MTIYIASDHAGLELKNKLKSFKFKDLGPYEYDSEDDYPDFAAKVCKAVRKNKKNLGILICGAGHGMNIAANKFKGIRASVCWNKKSVQCAREHNSLNVLCLPGRLISEKTAKEIIRTWLKTKPSKQKRHQRRLNKIKKLEK